MATRTHTPRLGRNLRTSIILLVFLLLPCTVVRGGDRLSWKDLEKPPPEIKGAKVGTARQAEKLGLGAYMGRIGWPRHGLLASEAPGASVTTLDIDLPGFAKSGQQVWEVRITSLSRDSRRALRAIILIHPETERPFVVLGPWDAEPLGKDNESTPLDADSIASTVCSAAQTGLFEESIQSGPKAGQTVKAVRADPAPDCLAMAAEGASAFLGTGADRSRQTVSKRATRYECVRVGRDRDWPFNCFEFRIHATSPGAFEWSCWAPDFPRPHMFKLLAGESETTYACYIGSGIHLYRLGQNRKSDVMRRLFLEQAQHPDTLPTVPLALLFEKLGRTNMIGQGPRTWNVTVETLTDKDGEILLTVHGLNPELKTTFALRNGTWGTVPKQTSQ